MKKKWPFLALGLVLMGIGIFFYWHSGDSVVEESAAPEEAGQPQVTKDENAGASITEQIKDVKVVLSKPIAQNFEAFTKDLDNTIELNRKELEECEGNFDRVFGNSLEEENPQFFSEDQVIEVLDEFDNLPMNPKSSSRLLELLAQDQVSKLKPEDVGQKLKELRPCRPYKKMSFIHGLMTYSKKGKWAEATKQRAMKSICKYFNKELGDHTTISNLNMQASLLHTLVSEGMFEKKYEERVMDFKDELEDSYDDLLDQADEVRESKEAKGEAMDALPLDVIQNEFKLSIKYREGMKKLLGEIHPDCE
ncbi:MAG: hypothetical protein A2X86_10755 [Bdellovibrionales bacterium GWA2_49_15]|nr:MAG: hypothetical protein A2X86_10755 [Bdellovibrionales bacterium GWA2_49_15]HAZ11455.1 hypothetical protein [Bdellovibrionales bacterium]